MPNVHLFPAFFLHLMDFFAVLISVFTVNIHMEDKISQLWFLWNHVSNVSVISMSN